MIKLLGSNIKTTISKECQNKPFSIIIDETCDISTEEQVTVMRLQEFVMQMMILKSRNASRIHENRVYIWQRL